MNNYQIIKCEGKFEVRHIYGSNVYCKSFSKERMANIHLFFRNLEGE